MANTQPRFEFDGVRMAEDMLLKGWLAPELARRAGVSDMTVYRFLSGQAQTSKMAIRLSKALGQKVSRYLIAPKRRKAA